MRALIPRTAFILGWLALFLVPAHATAQTAGEVGWVTPAAAAQASGISRTTSLYAYAINPEGGYEGPTYTGPTWSWTATGVDGLSISGNQNATLTAKVSPAGTYTITVKATATWDVSTGGTVSAYAEANFDLVIVGVKNIQVQTGETYTNVSGTVYVLVGEGLSFKAISTPTDAAFPTDQPVWSGSASGTGDTAYVQFTTASTTLTDYKTVTVACGDSTMSANVIVYDLVPKLTPQDNFEGRDLDYYGVCELIDLSFTTTPTGISASNVGTLKWEISSGNGFLTDKGGGTGIYECADVADTVTLGMVITTGPMQGGAITSCPAITRLF